MRAPHRLGVFTLFVILVLGCGKKPGSDASPAPEPKSPPGAQAPAGAPGIEGTYLIVGGEMFGEKATDEEITKDSELDRTVKISKDQIQFRLFKGETVRYKLDPSKVPAELDLFMEAPGKKTEMSYGIYKVEGNTLTLFMLGAKEPQLRPREFKTLGEAKDGKIDPKADKQVGGFMVLILKKVSNDTTFITEPPPKPKPPEIDEDGPVVAELTKKGFIAEKWSYGKFPGIDVTVPSTVPPEAIKDLSGRPRIRTITFKKSCSRTRTTRSRTRRFRR